MTMKNFLEWYKDWSGFDDIDDIEDASQEAHIAYIEYLEGQRNGLVLECLECEQALGKVLGYPWYKDDLKNFPNATEKDGVCTGEHVPGTIAAEAAGRITNLETERDAYLTALNTISAIDPKKCPFEIYDISHGAVLREQYKDWAKWDGDYRKTWYLAKTKEGKVYGCWPNAGKMVCVHKHESVEFTDEDDIEVRETTLEEIQELT